jgi:hypothetical protein
LVTVSRPLPPNDNAGCRLSIPWIRSLLLPQLSDDIFGRQQVLKLLWTERCKFRDRLADGGWIKSIHKLEGMRMWIGH